MGGPWGELLILDPFGIFLFLIPIPDIPEIPESPEYSGPEYVAVSEWRGGAMQ